MRRLQAIIEQNQPRRSRRDPLVSLLALAALFAVFAGYPTSALATCGDYLSHSDRLAATGMRNHQDVAITGERASSGLLVPNPGVSTKVRHRTEQIPCRGPHCKRAPSQTPLPNPIVSLDDQDRWFAVVSITVLESDDSENLDVVGDRLPKSLFAFRLERPPKQA